LYGNIIFDFRLFYLLPLFEGRNWGVKQGRGVDKSYMTHLKVRGFLLTLFKSQDVVELHENLLVSGIRISCSGLYAYVWSRTI
jgi:hypothetical protein